MRDSAGLMGDVYENSFTMRMALGTEDGPSLGNVAERTWGMTVHPLHGLRFDLRSKQWIVEPLFDVAAPPVTLGTWLKQRLFRVDQRVYSLGDTLKFVTNKEAVHVDIGRDEQSKDMERVHFGHTTYPHMVASLVGVSRGRTFSRRGFRESSMKRGSRCRNPVEYGSRSRSGNTQLCAREDRLRDQVWRPR